MARIPYAEEGTEAEGAKDVYSNLKTSLGMVPNLVKLLGHSGPATQAMGAILETYFQHLSLTTRIREMAYLTVARYHRCAYCIGHHTFFAKQAGLTNEEIALLGEPGFTNNRLAEAEQAVVRFAYETTKSVVASDEAIAALKKYYSLTQIAEIAFVVAAANFIQRIGKNLGVEFESPR